MPSQNSLEISYTSPSSAPFTLSTPLPSLSDPSNVPEKTAYLSALRTAINDAQAHINTELTARMEEDKAREISSSETSSQAPSATNGNGSGRGKGKKKGKKVLINEEAEEENYGEEVVDED